MFEGMHVIHLKARDLIVFDPFNSVTENEFPFTFSFNDRDDCSYLGNSASICPNEYFRIIGME